MMVRGKLRVQCTGPECRGWIKVEMSVFPPGDCLAPISGRRHRFATRLACAPLRSPQAEKQMIQSDVLIIGAGPTGLVLALWLTRLGVRVRIVDKTEEPGTTSRALAVQARTLELYRQIGLADAVVERGRTVAAANIWVAGKRVARAVFGAMGAGLSPFPYALIFPQDEHERLLIDRLAEASVEVERRTELLGFEEATGRVRARLKRPDGASEACEAAYIAGCDGAHSTVREGLK